MHSTNKCRGSVIGRAMGAKAPLNVSKKRKNRKYGCFHAREFPAGITKLSFPAIFEYMKGLLTQF